MDFIEQNFEELYATYRHERFFKSGLDACDHNNSLADGWKLTQDRFRVLKEFCGGSRHLFQESRL